MKSSWIQRTLVYICVLFLFFTILPVKQTFAIPRPCTGAIGGSISPASCGAGFRITIKNEKGEIFEASCASFMRGQDLKRFTFSIESQPKTLKNSGRKAERF